ncbi:MAG: AI-2E family transporter [Clostridiales bacterium]|nr:AI-2E family transporter [Clostridiales bacterium]
MRRLFDEDTTKRLLANLVVVIAGISFALFLYWFDQFRAAMRWLLAVLTPFTIGFVLAFLMEPIVERFDGILRPLADRGRMSLAARRALSLAMSYLLLSALVAAFFSIMLPLLIDSMRMLVATAPGYVRAMTERLSALMGEYQITNEYLQRVFGSWEQLLLRAVEYTGSLLPNILSISANISTGVTNVLLGVIMSVYMLFGKERFAAQSKKALYATMRRDHVTAIVRWARVSHRIFSRYIVGTIVNALIVGTLCYLGMVILRMEYALLISVIVALTSVIPFFGATIGWLAGGAILLIVNPMNALYFTIFLVVMMQLEANIVAPRVMGDSIGISSFWVLMALVLGGGLFGFTGMLVAIPVFALLYAIIQSAIDMRLKHLNLPTDTATYMAPDFEPPPDAGPQRGLDITLPLPTDEPAQARRERPAPAPKPERPAPPRRGRRKKKP